MRSWFSRIFKSTGSVRDKKDDSLQVARTLAQRLREEIPQDIRSSRHEAALTKLRAYAQIAWWSITDNTFDTWFDTQILTLAGNYRQDATSEARRKVLYVTSGILATGGLTQLLVNLIAHHDHDSFDFSVYSTEMFKKSEMECERAEIIRGFCTLDSGPKDSPLLERIQSLTDYILEQGIDVLVFLLSPDDVVGLMVASIFEGLPSIFINASHHVFAGGSFQFDHFVDLQPFYHRLSVKHARNADLLCISMGARMSQEEARSTPTSDLRQELGIPSDALLTVTVGNASKSLWADDSTYVDSIADLLNTYDHVHHLLIAANAQPLIAELCKRHRDIAGRIHEWSTSQSLIPILKACDIYINSYPIGGGLSTLDAFTAEIPVICSSTQAEWFGLDEQIADGPDRFRSLCFKMVTDSSYRAKCVKDQRGLFDRSLHPRMVAEHYEALILRSQPERRYPPEHSETVDIKGPRAKGYSKRIRRIESQLVELDRSL